MSIEVGDEVNFVTEHGAVLRSGGTVTATEGPYTVYVAWPAQGSLPAAELAADRESLAKVDRKRELTVEITTMREAGLFRSGRHNFLLIHPRGTFLARWVTDFELAHLRDLVSEWTGDDGYRLVVNGVEILP